MPMIRLGRLFCMLFLVLAACAPQTETAVSPTPLPATAATVTKATAVPPTPLPATATTVPAATAVPPTATFIPATPPMPTVTADSLVIAPENVAQLTQVAQFGRGVINDITWSPDGATFAVASGTGVHLYDTAAWQPEQLLETDELPGGVEFLPEGSFLAVTFYGMGSSFHELWDSETGQLVRQIRFDSGFSTMSADGQLIIEEQLDLESFRLRWQDVETNEVQRTLDLPLWPLARTAKPWPGAVGHPVPCSYGI